MMGPASLQAVQLALLGFCVLHVNHVKLSDVVPTQGGAANGRTKKNACQTLQMFLGRALSHC